MGSVSDPIRGMLIQYLNGPGLEVVPITAMLPTQIEAEAKEKASTFSTRVVGLGPQRVCFL
jgi:hypothetical protein